MKQSITQAKTNLPIATKRQIDELTKNWGMSTSTYIRMAINQAIKDQTIPFQITALHPQPSMKGRKAAQPGKNPSSDQGFQDALRHK